MHREGSERLNELVTAAWQPLRHDEEVAAWQAVATHGGYADFQAPGLRRQHQVPKDFDFYHPKNEALLVEVNLALLSAFRRCVPPGQFVYALDWQHTGYRFFLHEPFERFASPASLSGYWGGPERSEHERRHPPPTVWRVPYLCEGDYYLHRAPDGSFGTWGHPWTGAFHVFGALVTALEQQPLPALLEAWLVPTTD